MQLPASFFRIGLISLTTSAMAYAEVRFDTTRIEIAARPDQEKVEAVFPLENRGSTPARIVSVTSGCQCLEAAAPTSELAPGAKDKVTGLFKNPGIPGVSEKSLMVRIEEDGKVRQLSLTLAVEVRELIRIEPRTMTWTAGGESGEQTFTVTMADDEPIRLLSVSPSRPGFDIRLETVREGAEYRVHVKPESCENPTLGVFRFHTDCKFPRLASPIAFGHVKK